jgi:hypothetical protein
MADFKTHITVSTAIGVAYGGGAFLQFGDRLPGTSCLLAGALCSVSGMLPDLDSDSGVPLRESLSFASACIPMLLLERFQRYGWTPEMIVLAGAAIYGVVRFGVGTLLKKYTVHRGMFHSIPAAVIAGELAFLLCSHGNEYVRAYKAGAVVLGFMSHLILDEIWSVKVSGGRIGLKSSSGTAVKFWGGSMWANVSTYAKLAALSVLVFKDPMFTNIAPELHAGATKAAEHLQISQGTATDWLAGNAPAGAVPASAIRPATPPPPLPDRPAPSTQANTPTGPGGVYVPQGTYVPQGLYAPQAPYAAPTSGAPGYAPGYAPPGYGPQGYGPQGYGPGAPAYGQPGYGAPPNYQPAMPGYPNPMGVGPGMSPPRY